MGGGGVQRNLQTTEAKAASGCVVWLDLQALPDEARGQRDADGTPSGGQVSCLLSQARPGPRHALKK